MTSQMLSLLTPQQSAAQLTMSARGPKRTQTTPANVRCWPKADIRSAAADVRLWPKADIRSDTPEVSFWPIADVTHVG